MATVRFVMNPALIAELGAGPQMVEVMKDRAEASASVARATAPVAQDSAHPGEFRDSIEARAGIEAGKATGSVITTDPAGAYIEFGTSDTPAHATLRRAVEATVGPVRG